MKKIAIVLGLLLLSVTASADFRLGVSVGYSPNYTLKFTSIAVVNSNVVSADVTSEFKSALEIGVDLWNVPKNSWGFISGFQLSPKRDLKEMTVMGVSYSGDSKAGTSFLYLGTAYRWEQFYIPLAITYGFHSFQAASGATGEFKMENGVGAMLGLGWFITDDIGVELVGKSATTKLVRTLNSVESSESGTVATGVFNLKFFF